MSDLRKEILEKVKEFYNVEFQKKEFVPGETRINYSGRVFDEKEIINLVDSALDFWLTSGRYSDIFEKKLSAFLKVHYCHFVNSGSSANLLAISALTSPKLGEKRLKPGDELITVAAGFPTTITPIFQNKLVPVFIDVELGIYNAKTDELKNALSKKTKAVIFAHTLGNPFDIDFIKSFCRENNLWLIEDNCDSLGSKYNNKYTGTFGDISTCSFYPPHHITTGEGGAVLTDSSILSEIILSFRDWGRDCYCPPGKDNTCGRRFTQQFGNLPFGYDHKYVYSHLGYNLKATEMQAAIGVAQIDKLPDFIRKRKENFDLIHKNLKKYKDIFIFPQPQNKSEPSWFGYLITLKDGVKYKRNELINHLEKDNIQTRLLFSGNIIRQPVFQYLKIGRDYKVIGELKNTDKIMNDSFWLGVYPGLSKKEIFFILESIYKFLS